MWNKEHVLPPLAGHQAPPTSRTKSPLHCTIVTKVTLPTDLTKEKNTRHRARGTEQHVTPPRGQTSPQRKAQQHTVAPTFSLSRAQGVKLLPQRKTQQHTVAPTFSLSHAKEVKLLPQRKTQQHTGAPTFSLSRAQEVKLLPQRKTQHHTGAPTLSFSLHGEVKPHPKV